MKYIKKDRGLTLIGVVVALGVIGSSVPGLTHVLSENRAQDRLSTIVRNLAGIDMAASQWTGEPGRTANVTRPDLDGSAGAVPYIQWPDGPVAGTYSLVDIKTGGLAPAAKRQVVARATFNGGTKGPMNRLQWQQACGHDPTTCGL
ncbi:MAG: hypothetical protein ACYC96_01615 [Fimbriimonadaceae bacterium]